MSRSMILLASASVLLSAACSAPKESDPVDQTTSKAQGLVAPENVVIKDFMIATPLTPEAGIASRGIEVMTDRRKGNCVACHQVSTLAEVPFQGNVGPSLDGAGERWNEARLRTLVVNPKTYFPNTVMPAYYRIDGLNRVRDEFAGKPILTAQEVEDVVAFLKTLRSGDGK